MRKAFIIFALSLGTSGCFPGLYAKHVEGRVVDNDGKPLTGATILLTVHKECGSLGGGSREIMREAIGETSKDGQFSVRAAGSGLLYFIGLAGCTGFSKTLQICKEGRWSTGYSNSPLDRKAAKLNASGSYVFEPPRRNSEWHTGDFSQKAHEHCVSSDTGSTRAP